MLTSEQVLTHYDPALPVKLACDASPTSIGAVLSNVMPDGSERSVAFVSRALTKTEHRYVPIDKEALSIVWGMKSFHVYLYGRGFTLITDHKPLTAVFHPEKGVPAMSAARLQRYALFIAGFDYKIECQTRTKHCNAINCKLFLKMLDSTRHNLIEFSLSRLKELRHAICCLFKKLQYFFVSVKF